MASVWIESHASLRNHPKVRRLARHLGIPVPAVIGHLHCLWYWATEYARDGDLTAFDSDEIADAALFKAPDYDNFNLDAEGFLSGLIATRWIDSDEHGKRLHDWWEYAGQLLDVQRQASVDGKKGNHKRWHVDRGVSDPTCPFCREERRPESPPESPPDKETPRPESHRTEPNPTEQDQDQNLAPKRAKDELFESVATVCNIDWTELTKPARGAINNAVAQLRAVGAEPIEVERRAANYPSLFPGAALTPNALAKHWPQLAQARPPNKPKDRYMDMAERFHEREEARNGQPTESPGETRRGLSEGSRT